MLLAVKQIDVAYGPVEVLRSVSLSVEKGSVVTLIGSNGAGKTTTLRTISGLMSPKQGSIEFEGQNIALLQAEQIVKLGIALVPEGRGVFTNLSIYENLLMGGFMKKDKKRVKENIEKMYQIFPRLKERSKQLAGTLSGGEQQMLAIARALISDPKLLLLDEPSMGLAPQLVEDVADVIENLRAQGVTILLVEQNANMALSISDYAFVMETGKITTEGPSSELLQKNEIIESYFGGVAIDLEQKGGKINE